MTLTIIKFNDHVSNVEALADVLYDLDHMIPARSQPSGQTSE